MESKGLGDLATRLTRRSRRDSGTVRPVKVYEVPVHARLRFQAGSAEDAARKADDVLHELDGVDKRAGRPRRVRYRDESLTAESNDATDPR